MFSTTNICCMCLKNNNELINIHNFDPNNVKIEDKLKFCIPELTNNTLQNEIYICCVCHDRLNLCYNFKNVGMQKYKLFMNHVNESKQTKNNGIDNVLNNSTMPVPNFVNIETEIRTQEKTLLLQNESELENKATSKEANTYNLIKQESDLAEIQSHSFNEDGMSNENNGESISYNEMESDRNNSIEGNQFTCSFCQKQYCNKRNLKVHMRLHTGEKPFSCAVCQKRFNAKSTLIMHFRNHTGDQPFTCSLCPRRFAQKSNLNKHLRVHSDEKPFSCSFCQRNFARKDHLNKHLLLHYGEREKSFSCFICNKQFTRKEYLNKHVRRHIRDKQFTPTQ